MMTQFSLTWDAHKQNICNGLSALQQNGEFVDMTLAADGYHVKVHRMVLSLASPYIKELLGSTQCPHPIIFLNKISYATLCSILEYIYTGEVLVAKENLSDLIEAGKELCITGLEEMKIEMPSQEQQFPSKYDKSNEIESLSYTEYSRPEEESNNEKAYKKPHHKLKRQQEESHRAQEGLHDTGSDISENVYDDVAMDTDHHDTDDRDVVKLACGKPKTSEMPSIQYTMSTHGQIQLILNRFIYNLRYSGRTGNGHRQWRCVDYQDGKCAAGVVTRNDVVIQRFSAHNHGFHDKKILKKVKVNAVFSAILDAEEAKNRSKKPPSKKQSISTTKEDANNTIE